MIPFFNVSDFHNASAWAHIRHAWFWITILKAIMVFCGDVWTCIVLLTSSTWTLEIKPVIPISVARWIFAGSLLSSWILWVFDFRRANKIIKDQDVSNTISNKMASWFYCLQGYDCFCFVDHITGHSGPSERILLFVFHELQVGAAYSAGASEHHQHHGRCRTSADHWFDLGRLDELDAILSHLKGMYKLAFCAMAFTSLMFILSGIATLIAVVLWIFFFGKTYGDLKEDVRDLMNKRINAVIKKSTSERVRQSRILEKMEDKEAENARRSSEAGGRSSGSYGGSLVPLSGNGSKSSPMPVPQRPKPTLPDVDVKISRCLHGRSAQNDESSSKQTIMPLDTTRVSTMTGHHYHDPRPHTPELPVLNDHPEYWPLHHGLVFGSALSETHSVAEEPTLQRSDTNDRYSMHAAKQDYNHRQWPETADGSSFPRKGTAEEEQLTVSNRSISIGSRSSMTSQRSCTAFEPSYATALRREKQQQQQQQSWNHYKPSDFLFNLQPPNPVWTARHGSAWSNSSSEGSGPSQQTTQ
ncbi:MAG: hypothetical protein J3Q66DRAFT_432079 [Benniella sp.]|nr:MAG: hypothetical protein J3Q66DRAFT_432079 [Benniella sp.]